MTTDKLPAEGTCKLHMTVYIMTSVTQLGCFKC